MPFVKTGGLADVLGSLPSAIRRLGHEVAVFLPRYKAIHVSEWKLETAVERLSIPLGSERETGRVYRYQTPDGVTIYLIDHPEFFCRDELYGTALGDYPDNDRRFIFFQRGVFETLKELKISPDMIHCHDWHTGLIPIYLKTLYAGDPLFKKTKSVMTIHNLAYQGTFPPDSMSFTGLGWEMFKMDRLEFYGKVNFLKGGIVFADMITTVSETYAKEIQTKEFGCGLEGVLTKRKRSLAGIVNGISAADWDPAKDADIKANFDIHSLHNKKLNKAALQEENGFRTDEETPLFGMISRLTDQKGFDIIVPALREMAELGIQWVLLGTGEEKYHRLFQDMAKKRQGRFAFHLLFDAKMAKRIYAGSDVILVPSQFEPCGLAQMIAMRFGSIPLVRSTGGLVDTVSDFNEKSGRGDGFCFKDYSSEALLNTVERAAQLYRKPRVWEKLMKNAMRADFSWEASAKRYIRLYRLTKRLGVL